MEFEKLIAFGFILFGLGGVLYSLLMMLKSVGAKKWILSKAHINNALIDEDCDEDGCTYEAKVNFSYNYKSINYNSDKVAFGYFSNSFEFLAKRLIKHYIPGYPTKVYVNPRRPQQAVLIVGIKGFHLFNIIFFSVFNLLGVYIFNQLSSV
jgi:hypothetical protein